MTEHGNVPELPNSDTGTDPVVLTAHKDPRPAITAVAVLGLALDGYLIATRPVGWWQLVLVSTVLCAVWIAFRWAQSKTTVTLAGDTLAVRSPFRDRQIRGEDVEQVRELPNGRSPHHLLISTNGSKLFVPTADVERGHGALFDWLAAFAPDAILDKRSMRTRRIIDERRAQSRQSPDSQGDDDGQ